MSLVNVDLLEPNKWNPNVMQPAEYESLKRDMDLRGPRGIDPILASPKEVFYSKGVIKPDNLLGIGHDPCVIVDGEHRWRAAKELGWKQILCTVEAIKEDDAKGLCYRRNRERGTIDPFKEAALFKSEVESKHTQKQIAEKYLIDHSTVAHRLSLLRLDTKVIETVRRLPRGTVTPSHLEPIATLEPEDQKKVDLKNPYSESFKSVKQIETEVARLKEMRQEQRLLEDALKTAKFPKCPKCGHQPMEIHYKKAPWVQDDRYHVWNLQTGKGLYQEDMIEQKGLGGETVTRTPSSVLRSAHTVKELAKVFADRAQDIVPQMDKITDLKVSGFLDNSAFTLDFNMYAHTMSVYIQHGGNTQSFSAEEHPYRSGEKSAVHCGTAAQIEKVKKFIEDAFDGAIGVQPKKRKKEETSP